MTFSSARRKSRPFRHGQGSSTHPLHDVGRANPSAGRMSSPDCDGRTHPPVRALPDQARNIPHRPRSEEQTSELQSLMRTSYAVFCWKKKKTKKHKKKNT